MGDFLQYTVIGLTVGSSYALVALGYTIVYGIIRLINFAQGDLSMVGAFIGWTLLVSLGLEHLPIYLALVVAFVVPMIGTAVVNLGILQFAYKPLLRRSLLAILSASLVMSLLLQNAADLICGAAIEAYPPNLLPLSGFFVGPVHVTYVQIALVTASLLLMGGLVAFVQGTTMGTAMRALAVDHDAARLMGIDVDAVIRIAFVLGAMLAAASGVMLGIYYVQIHFTMGFLLGLRAFTAAVLGGIGNIPGAMVGGLLIGLLEAYTTGYLSGTWEYVVVFGVLITVLIVKPTGLFGERVSEPNLWLLVPTLQFTVLFPGTAGTILVDPTQRLRSDSLTIVTLGFGEMTRITFNNWEFAGGPNGVLGIPWPNFFGYELNTQGD